MIELRSIFLALLTTTLLLCGCSRFGQDPVNGYLYTNTTVPYSADLDNTPAGDAIGKSKVFRIRDPFTNLGVYTEINTNAIGDIARNNGISKVYYADLETFSIFSIWRTQTLVIYGEKDAMAITENQQSPGMPPSATTLKK